MKISDAKKEMEIELTGTSHNNGITAAVFQMKFARPFQAKAFFDSGDIRTLQGKTGVNFSRYSEIAKALRSGKKDVLVTLPEDALAWVRTESEKCITEHRKAAEAVQVKTWTWTDDGMPVYSPDGVGKEFRPDLQAIVQKIEKYSSRIWKEMYQVSERVPDERGYRWYRISHEALMSILEKVDSEQSAKDTARKAEREAKEAAAFQKARETGEKVQIRKWAVPCEDREEECSTDIVAEYALPDGTKKREQYHTW